MARDVISADWIRGWAEEVEAVLAPLMLEFERRFGYKPDTNEVCLVGPPDTLADLGADDLPISLAELYHHVSRADLPDVWIGYFIHPLARVLDCARTEGLVSLSKSDDEHGTLFASDGGGNLFVADQSGRVHKSRAASMNAEFDLFADSVLDFLSWLRDGVRQFAQTGDWPADPEITAR